MADIRLESDWINTFDQTVEDLAKPISPFVLDYEFFRKYIRILAEADIGNENQEWAGWIRILARQETTDTDPKLVIGRHGIFLNDYTVLVLPEITPSYFIELRPLAIFNRVRIKVDFLDT